MKKLPSLAVLLAAFLLPLAFAPVALFHWKILALTLGWCLLTMVEPAPPADASTQALRADKGTKALLAASSLASIVAQMLDWAFFQNPTVSLWLTLAGTALILAGAGLRFWALAILKTNFSTTARLLPNHRLETAGPYRLVRHPAYLGSMFILVGQGIFLGSWTGAAVALLLMGFAYHRRISVEEDILNKRFPAEYERIKRKTWRLVPLIY